MSKPQQALLTRWHSLALVALIFLPGCVYVPVAEHPIHNFGQVTSQGTEADFRKLVGDENSKRPIHPGATRAEVDSLIGQPINHFADQNIYTLLTERAVWVYPFWLSKNSAQLRAYALQITYDQHGTLVKWEMAHAEENRDFIWGGYTSKAPSDAVELLKQNRVVSSAALPTTQPLR